MFILTLIKDWIVSCTILHGTMAKTSGHRKGIIDRLGHARWPAVIGLYALLLELFFGAMHAAALAASAFGPPRNPDSFLFMICTPNGLVSVQRGDLERADAHGSPTAPTSRKSASDFCPVCGSSAVSPFTFAAPASVPPAPQILTDKLHPDAGTVRSLTAWWSVRIRAPPAS